MGKKYIWLGIQILFVVTLIAGTVKFFSIEEPTVKDTLTFLPAVVCIALGAIHGVIWHLLESMELFSLAPSDSITLLLIVASIASFLVAFFGAGERSRFAWDFTFALITFTTGYEAGKGRMRIMRGNKAQQN